MALEHDLQPGDVIDNTDLAKIFKVSPQGGMRRSLKTNSLVIISDHTRGNVYEDRWMGDIFHYTGMGLTGDQSLYYKQNRTLAQSASNGVRVYLFEVFKPKKYTFQGRVELIGKPYKDTQPDVDGQMRNVWVFPLKVVG